jgi:hypothetical protein
MDGRLEAVSILLPREPSQLPDLFIYLIDKNKYKMGFLRYSGEQMCRNDPEKYIWEEFTPLDGFQFKNSCHL